MTPPPPASHIRLRWLLTAAVIALLALIVLQFFRAARPAHDPAALLALEPGTLTPPAPSVAAPLPEQVVVDVIGAVLRPGIYALTVPARVDDALRAAGGLAPDADREAVNLAARLDDGQQLRIPRAGAVAGTNPADLPADAARININTADAAALDTLPGIGPATAQAIVAYRAGSGPFKQIEELEQVKGIGPGTLEKIKAQITVGP